jgi:hypothetical protein
MRVNITNTHIDRNTGRAKSHTASVCFTNQPDLLTFLKTQKVSAKYNGVFGRIHDVTAECYTVTTISLDPLASTECKLACFEAVQAVTPDIPSSASSRLQILRAACNKALDDTDGWNYLRDFMAEFFGKEEA